MIRYVQFGINQQENIFIHFPIDFHVEQSGAHIGFPICAKLTYRTL